MNKSIGLSQKSNAVHEPVFRCESYLKHALGFFNHCRVGVLGPLSGRCLLFTHVWSATQINLLYYTNGQMWYCTNLIYYKHAPDTIRLSKDSENQNVT